MGPVIVVLLLRISKVTTGIVVNVPPGSEARCCFFWAFLSSRRILSIWSLMLHLRLWCRHGTQAYFVPSLILMHSTLLLRQ
jgi:hypothetical protein